MNLDGIILEVIAGSLQLLGFLDTGLTVVVFTAVLGVAMVAGGLICIAHARLTHAPNVTPDRGAE